MTSSSVAIFCSPESASAGVAELGSTALLAPYVAAPQLAIAILLWRFATCYWHILAGAPVLLVLIGRRGVQKLQRQVSEGP